jgi:hydroxyacylglutathione hydrolase
MNCEQSTEVSMEYRIIPVTPFQQNCTLLWCEDTGKAVVIDPGGEVDRILGEVSRQRVELEKILVTHGHLDHAGGVAEIAARLRLPVEGPNIEDQFWIEALAEQGRMFGVPPGTAFVPERWLDEGDSVSFGRIVLEVRHCPGHTPGHVIFFCREGRLAVVGDVLFAGSIGRTDFPGGNHAELLRSIRERLWPLGDDVSFIPGHGPMSSLGRERLTNPFVADGN